MAYENFPSAANQPIATPPRYNWMPLVAGVLFFSLAFAIGYILWYKNQTLDDIQQQLLQQQKRAFGLKAAAVTDSNSSTQISELQQELKEANERYEALKALDAKKDSLNSLFVQQITMKKDSIVYLLFKQNSSKTDLSNAKKMIGSLKENIEGYKTNIEKVSGEKITLIQEKQTVEKQRDDYKTNLDSAYNVIKQKEDSIDIGTTLSAVNFSILSIDEKNNGKEKETSVAKKVDKLRIAFEIGENRLAASGIKELYICVTDPSGNPIAVEALGSGKFNTRDGDQKFYTEKMNINYIQGAPHQIISFDWKQNTTFDPGNYRIEVYNNGFKIGEGVRALKKSGGLSL
ncbi:coiled-coil domain-containing protein [Ferruginibacter albus]|uniref:hypothetical protein n=1 Tax=Ferruginibacter albus TaxID=2875540 RepID=UPI001CC4FDFD|nr:hypothetical protein [Ferruginibacter albus]UAY50981.1 hypothetical protein K9M53_10315 [Ferruginibacter albus]